MSLLERELVVVSEYTLTRKNLYFSPNDIIHYIYRFDRSPGGSKEFIVTLEKKSLGYVEIELKKKHIEPSTRYIKDRFTHLDEGKYRVNLVFGKNIIDTVYFEVIPDDGYHFESAGLDADRKETDEIIKYSR